jgi:6-phosphogluconate dehydrogenase
MGSGSTSSTAEAKLADIGVIGLGVMGQNLALNLDDHGYVVSCYNRTTLHLTDFLNGAARGTKVRGAMSLPDLVQSLRMPRKILLMVKAGQPVDDLIEVLTPLLQRGDILIDGGNSHFRDTDRRCKLLESKGLLYLGCGISGGEEGARHGPSLMPGGSPSAWDALAPIFCDIAAKVDVRSCIDAKNFAYFPKSVDAVPCAAYVGPLGAGHFVKMVHNGIEYGDMQLIGECFHVLLERSPPVDVAATFKEWSMAPELDSFLAEITCDILSRHAPDEPSGLLVSRIRDVAGQKGTGKWTVMSGLEDLPSGAPVTLIAESVFARILSSLKADRLRMSAIYARPQGADDADEPLSLDDVKSVCTYIDHDTSTFLGADW